MLQENGRQACIVFLTCYVWWRFLTDLLCLRVAYQHTKCVRIRAKPLLYVGGVCIVGMFDLWITGQIRKRVIECTVKQTM